MKLILTASALLLISVATLVRAEERTASVLQELNLARTHPLQYAQILRAQGGAHTGDRSSLEEAINFLLRAKPVSPLTFSAGLSMGAMAHVASQGGSGETGHQGSDHSTPWDRMGRFGSSSGTVGENISYGISDPRQIVVALIVDAGISGRGHRRNIFFPGFGVVGVAYGSHARYGTMCVMDFAGGYVPSSFTANSNSQVQDKG